MSDQALYQRTLRRALEITGGQTALQRKLAVAEARLASWLQGAQPIPEQVFLQLVDIVVTHETVPVAPRSQSKPSKGRPA